MLRYVVDTSKPNSVRHKALDVLDAMLLEYKFIYDEDIIAGELGAGSSATVAISCPASSLPVISCRAMWSALTG